jgi:hypothetical protein
MKRAVAIALRVLILILATWILWIPFDMNAVRKVPSAPGCRKVQANLDLSLLSPGWWLGCQIWGPKR